MRLHNSGSLVTVAVLLGLAFPSNGDSDQEPPWKSDFRAQYGLKEGELIRRIAPPYPACRAEFFRDRLRQAYNRSNEEVPEAAAKQDYSDYFTKLAWKDGWPVAKLTMQTVPVKPDEGVQLSQLLRMVTGFNAARTDGDGVLARKVTGDFVIQAGADPERLAGALEKILRRECNVAVSIKVEEQEQVVYVFSGRYKARPLPDRKHNQVEIYAFQLGDRREGGGGTGSFAELADHLEGFIGQPVVLEDVADAPKVVEWHYNEGGRKIAGNRNPDRDADPVTENVAVQTGLRVGLETRKIKILVVKEVEEN